MNKEDFNWDLFKKIKDKVENKKLECFHIIEKIERSYTEIVAAILILRFLKTYLYKQADSTYSKPLDLAIQDSLVNDTLAITKAYSRSLRTDYLTKNYLLKVYNKVKDKLN